MTNRCSLVLLTFLAIGGTALGQEWTRFRGPNGSGISPASTLPTQWTRKDYDWKVAIPGIGHSSPVVWKNRIFVTSFRPDNGQRIVVCLDRNDGHQLWKKIDSGEKHRKHKRNSFATSTPVVDATRLYVTWGSPSDYLVKALDHDGKLVWEKDFGPFKSKHGFGPSPILVDDLLVLAADQDKKGYLLAVNKTDGSVKWKIPRKSGNATFSTPCVFHPEGKKKEIIFTNWKRGITSVDPQTGKINWEVSCFVPTKPERAISSPVVVGDLVLGTCGFVTKQKNLVAMRPASVSKSGQPEEVWRYQDKVAYMPTPLPIGNHVFLCSERGVASCLDAQSGNVVWQKNLANTEFYASPVSAGKAIYCTATNGEVFVFEATTKFRPLGRMELREKVASTPAIADGRIYFRTQKHLISIGGKSKN
ncbi:MAG: PQQ-binding-like beta-propeller repeat protein [Gemmataceae bacterium]